ncbi:MAG: HD domain-containing protein, partial [Promethearchaeota archaeon]
RVIQDFARKVLGGGSQGSHSFEHVLRVRQLCLLIGKEEDANLDVLEAAALLHDIGRPQETTTGVSHAIIGADMAVAFLATTSFPKDQLERVAGAIRSHRFSENLTPDSLEGEILSDADKLDAMGALGLARTIAESLARQRGLNGVFQHLHEKLLKLKDRMYTKTGRKLAEPRHYFLISFMRQITSEFLAIGEPLLPELLPFAPAESNP